jgi:hypothetical protein
MSTKEEKESRREINKQSRRPYAQVFNTSHV